MMEEAKGQQSLALDRWVLGNEGLFSGGTLKVSIPCANSPVSFRWRGRFVLQLCVNVRAFENCQDVLKSVLRITVIGRACVCTCMKNRSAEVWLP